MNYNPDGILTWLKEIFVIPDKSMKGLFGDKVRNLCEAIAGFYTNKLFEWLYELYPLLRYE